MFSGDPAERAYPAKKLYVDPYLDIAILQGHKDAHFRTRVPAATLDCESDRNGKRNREIAAIGYAGKHSFRLRYAEGERLGRPTKHGKTWVATDADYQHGMSGGPTIERASGRVLGISTRGYVADDSYNLGFTVPAKYVCRILDLLRSGVDPTPPRLPVVSFDKMQSRPVPDLLLVSDLTIGESASSSLTDRGLERELMIRMPGDSDAESTGEDFSTWMRYGTYVIVSVDGIPFDDIRDLYRHLAGVERSNQEAVFKFKKSRPGLGPRDAYYRLRVTPNDLRLVR